MHPNGFSLVEVCVGCALLALLVAAAAPPFSAAIDRHALRGSAAEFEGAVLYARTQARALSRSVVLEFADDAAGSCYVLHAGAPGDCACSAAEGPACSDEAEPLRAVLLPAAQRVRAH